MAPVVPALTHLGHLILPLLPKVPADLHPSPEMPFLVSALSWRPAACALSSLCCMTKRVFSALLVLGHSYTRHGTLSSGFILFLGSTHRAGPEAIQEQAWDDEENSGPVLQVGIHVWTTRLASPQEEAQ